LEWVNLLSWDISLGSSPGKGTEHLFKLGIYKNLELKKEKEKEQEQEQEEKTEST
jgi:hypothetical protein